MLNFSHLFDVCKVASMEKISYFVNKKVAENGQLKSINKNSNLRQRSAFSAVDCINADIRNFLSPYRNCNRLPQMHVENAVM